MNKFATIAVLALINNVSAINIRDADDDLFTDNASEVETLQSISQAEKAMGTKFSGNLTAEETHNLVSEKSKLSFENDQFVKNEKRTYTEKTLLQLNDDGFAGKPIGSFSQVRDEYRSADYDSKVLAGYQLNDEDDARATLESIKSAETINGAQMKAPENKPELF